MRILSDSSEFSKKPENRPAYTRNIVITPPLGSKLPKLKGMFFNRRKISGLKRPAVIHIWTQDMKISRDIASSSLIPNMVENATDMVGRVDAMLLARDDGEKGSALVNDPDTFFGFKSILRSFVRMLETGTPAFGWRETVEIPKVVVAARYSRGF